MLGADGEDDAALDDTRGPLMSWKAGGSWVSGVRFLKGDGNVVVSSCNDGRVIAWDVSKQRSGEGGRCAPPIVAEAEGLHRSGVFGMDLLGCRVAKASKDSSLGLGRVSCDGRIVVERRIEGHHRGVVRGVCFGDTTDKLVDCGADGRICVLDTRLPDACTLTIESKHITGVNMVEWCPSNVFLFMSASKDSAILLYDIRHISEPFEELRRHCEPELRTCSQIQAHFRERWCSCRHTRAWFEEDIHL